MEKKISQLTGIVLRLLLISFCLIANTMFGLGVSPAYAQSSLPPFTCSGDIFQVQSGQLRIFDPATSTYTNIGVDQPNYNSTAFNQFDNFAYGTLGTNLIRIGSNGEIETVTNLGFTSFSGDADFNNNYYVRRGNNRRYAMIDLATLSVTNLNFSGSNAGPADVAYLEQGGTGFLIGFSGGGTLFRYNLDTLVKEDISLPGLPSGAYGAAWTDSTGRLLTFSNVTGELFEIFDFFTDSPSFVRIGLGDPSGSNDAFSCSAAPFPNLAPLALDDEFTTDVNVPVGGNVLDDNGNGADLDPDNSPLTVVSTPVSDVSNGTLVLNPDGSFLYTPDDFFIGVDTFTYEIIDSGGLRSTATVTITVEGDIDYTVDKVQTTGPSPITIAGEVIGYQITLVNTGDIPLTNVDVVDTLPGGTTATLPTQMETGATSPPVTGQLDVGETWTYDFTYTVTQDDVDTGGPLTNNVDVSTDEAGDRDASVDTPVSVAPEFTLTKEADDTTLVEVGQVVTYTYTVTNTGTVTIDGVTITDDQQGAGVLGAITLTSASDSIAPGEIATFEAEYTVAQADIDAGVDILNTATATGTPRAGTLADQIADETVTVEDADPALTLTKVTPTDTDLAVGDVVTYTYTIVNAGNISVADVTVTDVHEGAGPFGPITLGVLTNTSTLSTDDGSDLFVDSLAPGDEVTFTADYTVTQADVDAGTDISNTATATGSPERGDLVDPTATEVISLEAAEPELSITKLADLDTNVAVDDLVTYTYTVTNEGNVTINDATISDVHSGAGVLGPITLGTLTNTSGMSADNGVDILIDMLAPGDSVTFTAEYIVTQDDIDAQADIVNTGTATGSPVLGLLVDPTADEVVTVEVADPALALDKALNAASPTSFSAVDEVLLYDFTVTNSGNTTITEPITITDALLDAPAICPDNTGLAPGDSLICSGQITVDLDDLNNGSVENTATATDGTVTSNDDTVSVPAVQMPSLSVVKTGVDPIPFQIGAVIDYTYVITNDGNITLEDEIVIADNRIAGPFACTPDATTDLAPGEALTCTASYTVVADDISIGSVTNTATATSGDATSPVTTATVPSNAAPALSVEKSVVTPNPATFDTVGDILTYQYIISNTGGASLIEPVSVVDDLAGELVCFVSGGDTDQRTGALDFQPGETLTCSLDYVVTQADVDAGTVTNLVFAESTFGSPSFPVTSPIDQVTVISDDNSSLAVTKSVTPTDLTTAAVGDEITYTVTIQNDGTVTMNDVFPTDSGPSFDGVAGAGALSAFTLTSGPDANTDNRADSLGPNETATFEATYALTQDDIDAASGAADPLTSITNTAQGTGSPSNGTPFTPVDSNEAITGFTPEPALTVTKTANLPTVVAAGEEITYVVIIENTGNVQIDAVAPNDAGPTFDGVAGGSTLSAFAPVSADLAPGDNETFVATYALTQADIDAMAGAADPTTAIDNTASAMGTPAGGVLDVTPDTAETGTVLTPTFAITKLADNDTDLVEGDVVTYTYTVTNTGDLTITDVSLTDVHSGLGTLSPFTVESVTNASGTSADAGTDDVVDAIGPDDTATLTATYIVSQADFDDGGDIVNTATAQGVSGAGPPMPVSASETVSIADGGPSLTLVKDRTLDTGLEIGEEGDTITYTYTVVNDGDVTIADVTITDVQTGFGVLSAISPASVDLAPTETQVFTATYVITQADIDAGVPIENNATATGTPARGVLEDPVDTASVDVEAADPTLEITKVANVTTDVTAGQEITYTYTVTNTGNITISAVDVTDVQQGTGTLSPIILVSGSTTLAPDEIATFEAIYIVTQDDFDAGSPITNTATADGTPELGALDPASVDEVITPAVADPELSIVKVSDVPVDEVVSEGDVVTYTYTVTNIGDVTINDVSVTDVHEGAGDLGPITLASVSDDLAPGEIAVFTATYTVEQGDIDAGGPIANTGTATGASVRGALQDVDDTASVSVEAQDPLIELAKSASDTTDVAVGTTITYTYVATNNGNVTINGVGVTDVQSGFGTLSAITLTSGSANLAPGDTATFTATYLVTQDDIDAGADLTNTATTTGTSAGGAPVTAIADEAVDLEDRAPALSVAKSSVLPSPLEAGESITYTFVITNTGNVAITDVAPDDNGPTFNGIAGVNGLSVFAPLTADLAPDADETFTATYVLDQLDIDRMVAAADPTTAIDNTASAVGTPPAGSGPIAVTPDTEETGIELIPTLSIVKLASTPGPVGEDDIITYTYVVTNTGEITITDVNVADDHSGTGLLGPITPASVDLAPGASQTFSATYTVTLGDVDAGIPLTNEATADGTPAGGVLAPVTDDASVIVEPEDPSFTFDKTLQAGSPDPFLAVGDRLFYDYLVTNTGNVTLSAFAVTDDRVSVSCPAVPFAPSASITCTSQAYTVTLADLDAGFVTNNASAVGQTPSGVTTDPEIDDFTVNADQRPELLFEKVVAATSDNSYSATTDVITYTFTVTNTGNVTTTAPIIVDDQDIPATVQCGPASGVAPGAVVTCEATFSPDQNDINVGEFENTASASTVFDGTPVISNEDTAIVQAIQTTELTIEKLIPNPPLTFDNTTTIDYTYTVTNSGNTTLTAPLAVTDSRIAAVDCSAAPATLQPTESFVCTASYDVQDGDLSIGSVTNTAAATGQFGSDPVTSNTDSALFPVEAEPGLEIEKALTASTATDFVAVGDILSYTYTLTNPVRADGGGVGLTEDIFITDDRIGRELCRPATDGTFNVGNTATCTFTYEVTQDDLDAGFVTNEVVADTIFAPNGPNIPVSSAPDTVTVDGVLNPELTVLKDVTAVNGDTGAADDDAVLDDVLTYTITTTNSGNQTISIVEVTDPIVPELTCLVNGVTPAPANVVLSPGDALICTGDYTVLQADIDAGERLNTATATGANPQGGSVEASGNGDHPIEDPNPVLDVEKALDDDTIVPAFVNPGDTVDFRITVSNLGNVTLDTVQVTDDLVAGICEVGTLIPGATDSSCVFTYSVTQDDIDNGEFENIATGAAQPRNPGAEPLSVADSLTVAGPARAPSIALDKTADLASFNADGQIITYTYTITNTGNITLLDLPAVTDDKIASVVCDPLPTDGLPPLGETTCTGTYETLQTDVNAGEVVNIANATIANPLGGPDLTATATETVPSVRLPGLLITKSADDTTNVVVGQIITYTYDVENTGNVTLTDVFVADLQTSASGTANLAILPSETTNTLAPDEIVTLTSTYTVTQEDVDAGDPITNIVDVTGEAPNGATPSASASESVDPVDPVTGLIVLKTASAAPAVPQEGDTITFTITAENTGNVTLSSVVLADDLSRADGTPVTPPTFTVTAGDTAPVDELGVDEIWTFTGVYTLTQADIDAGGLSNTATVSSQDPSGNTVADVSDNGAGDGDDPTVVPLSPAPQLDVVKVLSSTPILFVEGATVIWRVTAENTGNVSLTDVIPTDTLENGDGLITPRPDVVFQSGDGSEFGVFDPGEIFVYEVRHTLTQADIDSGSLSNSVRITADDPNGTTVADDSGTAAGQDDPTPLVIPAEPGIVGTKFITSSTTTVGGLVTFEITATNTGNVTLSSVDVASDTLLRADGVPLTLTSGPTFAFADDGSAVGTLLPDETATYRASYRLTQADVDAGGIQNQAVVTGTPPFGAAITDVSTDDQGGGNGVSDPAVLTIPANPSLLLVKSLQSGGPSYDTVGDLLTYQFRITNTGNVTITEPIVVTDPLITNAGGEITCGAVPLAPNGSLNCTGSYSVDQDDLDNGSVVNTASATDGTTTTNEDTLTVPANQLPSLEAVKTALSITPPNGVPDTTLSAENFQVGAVVDYQYIVTNDGNITLTDPITVSDNLISDVSCPTPAAGELIPTDSVTCTASYTVTVDDVFLGVVVNVASGSSGPITSPQTSETVPNDGTPSLDIDKSLVSVTNPDGTVDPSGQIDEPDDVINYSFTITNAGTQNFVRPVTVTDTLLSPSPFTCWAPGQDTDTRTAPLDFIVDDTVTCTGSYTATQADVNAGQVLNEAFAQTTFSSAGDPNGGTTVSSNSDSVITSANVNPAITVDKSVATLPLANVGQLLTYTLTINNTGNQTLSNVEGTDFMLPDLECFQATLAVGDSFSCSAPFSVTQADIDRGFIENTADVAAVDPAGGAVTDFDILITDGPAPTNDLRLTKTANPSPFGAPGTDVTYTFRVENAGNVTLFDVVVTDPLLDPTYSCEIGRLNVGEVNDACTATQTVTQEDVDRGFIDNEGVVNATDAVGTPLETRDAITTQGPTAAPSLNAVKTADFTSTEVDAVVIYSLVVTNTGNVTLDIDPPVDTMTRLDADATPTALDSAFVLTSGDDDNNGLLDVGEVFVFTAPFTVTQDDINAGGVSNTANVTATDPFQTRVADTSDDGDDFDGNDVNDPTVVPINPVPQLDVTKVLVTPGVIAGDEVLFGISATNIGNVTLTEVALTDTLTRLDGTDLSDDVVITLINPADADAPIAVGDTFQWEALYVLTQDDVDAGGISNTASVSGFTPVGEPVTDTSDNGDDADGNITDDPTVNLIISEPGLEAVKIITSGLEATNAGEDVTFEITVTNTGNVTINDLVVTDTLTNFAGDVLTPTVTFATGEDEFSLLPGAVNTFDVAYTLTQADVDAGGISNTVTADGVLPNGDPISDISDNGNDEDGNLADDPTQIVIVQTSTIDVEKEADTPVRIDTDQFEVGFTLRVTNTGNVTQNGLVMNDDLAAWATPAIVTAVVDPEINGFEGGLNPGYDGISDISVLADDVSLAPGVTGIVTFTAQINVASGTPQTENTVGVTTDLIEEVQSASVLVEPILPADIRVVKTATPEEVLLGGTVTYTITFENQLATIEDNLTFIDDMPAGIVYTPNSARFNGEITPQPVVSGRQLRWEGLRLGPNELVTITLEGRVTGGLGEMTNTAYAVDASGNRVSNFATATVSRRPEAVFDCGDVIGKVFDDVNQNGYQDEAPDLSAFITDQTFDGGKGETVLTPRAQTQGEPGLPNVRMSTVNGLIITTDEYGRFSVPCAELPAADIGSNFLLKLDERSLPTGYRVTTENPRVVRLTAGRMTRLNFGAAISNVVDIDLMDAAFAGEEPTEALDRGIDQLVTALNETPSVVRLTYYANGETERLALSRLEEVEDRLRERWRQSGRYRLLIERSVANVQ